MIRSLFPFLAGSSLRVRSALFTGCCLALSLSSPAMAESGADTAVKMSSHAMAVTGFWLDGPQNTSLSFPATSQPVQDAQNLLADKAGYAGPIASPLQPQGTGTLQFDETGQSRRPVSSADAPKLLASLLAIPYRADGAVTHDGVYTTFANPQKRFATPGLNCSGFVLEACRRLLNTSLTIDNAGFDRWGDSGPDSPHGEDWDYGWDLVCNICEGRTAHFLNPDGTILDPRHLDGFKARGYDLHAPGQLEKLLARLRPNHLYLLSFNKTSRKTSAPQHYHVALLFLNDKNEPLLYQTTTQRKRSYVRNLASPQGRASFLKSFANTRYSKKHVAVIETPMP